MRGSPQVAEPALTTSAEPATIRMRINPMPGQPPANMEYKRRKAPLFIAVVSYFVVSPHRPQKRGHHHSLGSPFRLGTKRQSNLEFYDASLQSDDRSVRPIIGSEFGENRLDPALYSFFGDGKLVRNLFVRVSGRD